MYDILAPTRSKMAPNYPFRYPAQSFEWQNYLRRPWKLRWRLRTIPAHFGREFQSYYGLLQRSTHWSQEQIDDYQWQRVKLLIDHAYRTVPFYRRWFDELQTLPEEIRSWKDFAQLPVISRADLAEKLADFTSSELREYGGSPARTSGSTGKTLKFYRSWSTESFRRAVQWRHFNQLGYSFKQPRVSLNVPFIGEESDLLYKYDPIENLIMFNGRFLDSGAVGAVCRIIRSFKPRMFYGHPSALMTLAKSMQVVGLPSLNVPVVYVYSESLTNAALSLINKEIGTRVFDHYGNRENTISASQMPCGNYHVNSEFVYTELIRSEENFGTRTLFKIIGTNLHNFAMPLIRYDCGDLAIEMKQCNNCSLAHPIVDAVGGREKIFLLSRHGLVHCQYDDILASHGVKTPDDFQVVQEDLDNLTLKIVPGNEYRRESDEAVLIEHLKDSTRGWFNIKVEYVEAIPVSSSFKKAMVVSKLGKQMLESRAQ